MSGKRGRVCKSHPGRDSCTEKDGEVDKERNGWITTTIKIGMTMGNPVNERKNVEDRRLVVGEVVLELLQHVGRQRVL